MSPTPAPPRNPRGKPGRPRIYWPGGGGARARTLSQQEDRAGKLLVSPTLLIVTLVVLIPFVGVVVLAFQDLRLIEIQMLALADLTVTFGNFEQVLTSSGFWDAFRTTFIYAVVTTVGSIGVGLVLALALRRPFRGRGAVRGLFLIPYVLPVVAAVTIWEQLLSSQYGLVNAFGRQFLSWDEPINFLATTSRDIAGIPVPVTLLVVIAFEVWKSFPLAFLFITARLQATQGDVEEAALIDGASPLQSFRHVLFPQLAGVIALLSVLRFIWSFQNFNDIYLLTGGAGGTQVLAVRVYEELINRANIGTASALGLVMTAVLAIFLLVYLWMSRREEAA